MNIAIDLEPHAHENHGHVGHGRDSVFERHPSAQVRQVEVAVLDFDHRGRGEEWSGSSLGRGILKLVEDQLLVDRGVVGAQSATLHHVLEFANIAGPVVVGKRFESFWSDVE